MDGESARHRAATYTGQPKHNKRRQASMPWVGFEPTIPVFERAKIFHALDYAATVIGLQGYSLYQTKQKDTVTEEREYVAIESE
jgi:hypothetical protein